MGHPLGSYEATELPLDSATMMNSAGTVAGSVGGQAAIYRDGAVTILPGKAGYTELRALAISGNGLIVGSGMSAGHRRGLFWSDPAAPPLDMGSPSNAIYPHAVNSSGVVVGYFDSSAGPRAFTWSRDGGVRDISPDQTTQSRAEDISDSGYITGWTMFVGESTPQAVRWHPDGAQGLIAEGYGKDVFEDGSVLGTVGSYTGAVKWSLANAATPFGPEPEYHIVVAVSSAGRLAGNRIFAPAPGPVAQPNVRNKPGPTLRGVLRGAARWLGVRRPDLFPTTLPNRAWTFINGGPIVYLPVPQGGVDTYAIDVSASGAILGSVTYSLSDQRPVIWAKANPDVLPPLSTR